MNKIKSLRGFRDIYGEEVKKFRLIDDVARRYFDLFGFREIIIPVLENTGLFIRSIGDTTDIVEKEMFTFSDIGGDLVTMRPEATAGMVRAYLEAGFYAKERVSKLFSIGPMFRHERPQKGRFREFRQIDVEVFGIKNPIIDAELLWMTSLILGELKMNNYTIETNSVGCPACREAFKKVIVAYFEKSIDGLCEDCSRRLQRNPLRIFDCKNTGCRDISQSSPLLFDNLCLECKRHFEEYLGYLDGFGVPVSVNKRLVRGLDYYTKTVFEVLSEELGAQKAFMAGGRYDNLVEGMGGPSIPGVGFAIGIERLSLLMEASVSKAKPLFFLAYLGDRAKSLLVPIMKCFIENSMSLSYMPDAKSLKSQMRYADSLGADYVLILGDDEIEKGLIVLRNMAEGSQTVIPLDISSLSQNLSAILKG